MKAYLHQMFSCFFLIVVSLPTQGQLIGVEAGISYNPILENNIDYFNQYPFNSVRIANLNGEPSVIRGSFRVSNNNARITRNRTSVAVKLLGNFQILKSLFLQSGVIYTRTDQTNFNVLLSSHSIFTGIISINPYEIDPDAPPPFDPTIREIRSPEEIFENTTFGNFSDRFYETYDFVSIPFTLGYHFRRHLEIRAGARFNLVQSHEALYSDRWGNELLSNFQSNFTSLEASIIYDLTERFRLYTSFQFPMRQSLYPEIQQSSLGNQEPMVYYNEYVELGVSFTLFTPKEIQHNP